MCGLAGSINFSFPPEKVTASMLHRGPDEQGIYRQGNVQFLHLRLSIIDAAGGKQPMSFADKYTIIFNGEIYNHRELRNRFNLQCKTESDTETLLLLYDRFGSDMLQYLDGMFVFVIHDILTDTLFIARDRAGAKPLYFYSDDKTFVFASELNALKSVLSLEIAHENFHSFLRFGTFFRELTPYKQVTELTAGSFLIVECSSLKKTQHRWWNVHDFYLKSSTDDFEEAMEKIDLMLHRAVKSRIENSDLEVGAFLSGGIDSGLVTAIASNYKPNIKTFTVSFDGEYDEAPLARLVADKYSTEHHEIRITFDNLEKDIERILCNYGEPFFDSSAIPSYYVSKAAKQFVTVILNGDGADELFGGYRRYVPFASYDFFKTHTVLTRVASVLSTILPAANNKKSAYNYFYRLLDFSSKNGLEAYMSAGVDIFEGFTNEFVNVPNDYMHSAEGLFNRINDSNLTGLEKMMNLDFDINLFNDLLVKMDIATMANSQEGRSPFLCKDLLEYVPGLPDKYKIKNRTTKALLRSLASRYLPPEIINQPKRGFEIPLKQWINDKLRDPIHSYLTSDHSLHRNYINPEFVSNLLQNKVRVSEEKRAKMIWTLFALEVWYQKNFKDSNY